MRIPEQILSLIKEINEAQKESLGDTLAKVLTAILCGSPAEQHYLAEVYKLIFYTYAHNAQPEIACELLSGFVRFGQSVAGAPFKPMLDYFAIEAFNGLLEMRGWAILKPCVKTLKETLANYKSEPLFKHIISCIVKQLQQDVNDMPYSSDLCYYLPHEKSYVLGWFSYIVATSYYAVIDNNKTKLNAKQLRKNMMFYRKLLIRLRRNVAEYVIYSKPETKNIEEKWESIEQALGASDYEWAGELIYNTLKEKTPASANAVEAAEASAVVASANEVVEAAVASAVVEAAVASAVVEAAVASAVVEAAVASANEAAAVVAANASEAVVVANEAANEVAVVSTQVKTDVAETPSELPEKKGSWLYSLFGWA
jgi:hypothetical protein